MQCDLFSQLSQLLRLWAKQNLIKFNLTSISNKNQKTKTRILKAIREFDWLWFEPIRDWIRILIKRYLIMNEWWSIFLKSKWQDVIRISSKSYELKSLTRSEWIIFYESTNYGSFCKYPTFETKKSLNQKNTAWQCCLIPISFGTEMLRRKKIPKYFNTYTFNYQFSQISIV